MGRIAAISGLFLAIALLFGYIGWQMTGQGGGIAGTFIGAGLLYTASSMQRNFVGQGRARSERLWLAYVQWQEIARWCVFLMALPVFYKIMAMMPKAQPASRLVMGLLLAAGIVLFPLRWKKRIKRLVGQAKC